VKDLEEERGKGTNEKDGEGIREKIEIEMKARRDM
jgi:hypothetical protein